jgi:hypothetical protein
MAVIGSQLMAIALGQQANRATLAVGRR